MTTDLNVSALTFDGSAVDSSPDATLRSLASVVREVAGRVDAIWSRYPSDGLVAQRLVEASHSLHRAAIALQDDVVIGRTGGS